MITDKILTEIREHAALTDHRESCGLIIIVKGKQRYVPCRNIAFHDIDFEIHPEDYADAEDKGTIQYIVHTHHYVNASPSQVDLINIEKSDVPWLIVNHPTGAYTITHPTGYVTPLEGRQFIHGSIDCLTLIQDYYKQAMGISMPDYVRPDNWWLIDEYNFYDNFYKECGFHKIPLEEIAVGDVIIMRLNSPKNNHGAVYMGNNVILHHCTNRLSCKDVYGGYWMEVTSYVLRHKDAK